MTESKTAIDASHDPAAAALEAALGLPDASFVIHRRGLLVEFKTDRLAERVSLYSEGRFRSWQVGAFEDHHCHPDLAAVRRVLFDAEPVPCQRGRINCTIWFLADGDCGNPHRPEGLFSVTLNRPYDDDGHPRANILDAMFALQKRMDGWPLVETSPAFRAYRRHVEGIEG
jgi:hypothetical protein